MKKTILAVALLASSFSAFATSQPAKPSPPVAAAAAAAAAPASAIAAPSVSVTGASTVAGAPLLLSLKGAKAIDPSFQQLYEVGQANPKWKVVQVKAQGDKSRMFLASTTGGAKLEMDAATSLVSGLKIKKDSVIDIVTQTAGKSAIIKFQKDGTPLGFMVNQDTQVQVSKK